MSAANQIAAQLPYLRRYARALTGAQQSGDAYVRATIEAALADTDLRDKIVESRTALYNAFTKIWGTGHVEIEGVTGESSQHEVAAQERLSLVTPIHRQALLLTSVEEFSYQETAEILEIPLNDIKEMVRQAISEIDNESATDVLIIEDEPLISMQLESLVSELGHNVIGTAATRQQALEIFKLKPAGLVLADIQLADGSSGIDAVEDMLKFGDVPVIFITAYPERLLTGARPEPTYLVTKPFLESTVRTQISQALFFKSSVPIN